MIIFIELVTIIGFLVILEFAIDPCFLCICNQKCGQQYFKHGPFSFEDLTPVTAGAPGASKSPLE